MRNGTSLGYQNLPSRPYSRQSGHFPVASIGSLNNISLSGGFIPALSLQLHSMIRVKFVDPLAAQPRLVSLSAFIARACDEVAGIVWCDFVPRVVVKILRAIAGGRFQPADSGNGLTQPSFLTVAISARNRSR